MPVTASLIAGGVIGGSQAILGGIQAFRGFRGLRELAEEPVPQFTISPELQRSQERAEELARRGFLPEEEAAFRGGLAQQQAAQFRRARDVAGGGLAGAIGGGIQAQGIGALQQFAAAGAGLRRQNIRFASSVAEQVQRQRNLATQAQIQQRQMREQALGQAAQAGLTNIVGGVSTAAAFGIGALGQQTGQAGTEAAREEFAGLNLPTTITGGLAPFSQQIPRFEEQPFFTDLTPDLTGRQGAFQRLSNPFLSLEQQRLVAQQGGLISR